MLSRVALRLDSMPRHIAFVIALLLALLSSTAQASEVVEIRVFDNSKTTDDTVIYIAGVDKGDEVDAEELQKIKERLVSSGLFKEVAVYTTDTAGGVRLNIEAKDKHSWAVAPTYYNQPTNKGFGFGFGENNLFGENKKLLLYGQVATGETFFVGALQDPQMWNSPFKAQLDVYLRSARIFEFASPDGWFEQTDKVRKTRLTYLNAGLAMGVNFYRVVSLDFRLRGAKVGYKDTELVEGAAIEDITGDPNSDPADIPEPGAEGWDVSGDIDLKISTLANWYGITTGTRLSFSWERALVDLGSDFDYWMASAGFLKAVRLFEKHNFIVKSGLNYGKDLPFQQEFTSGGMGLRGYRGNQFRGDFKASGSAEYSLELLNIKGVAFRALAFYDTAYTRFLDDGNEAFRNYLDGYDDKGVKWWRNSVGVGTRLYIRQLVLPLLGVDVGYAVEANAFEFFLAIGLTDT